MKGSGERVNTNGAVKPRMPKTDVPKNTPDIMRLLLFFRDSLLCSESNGSLMANDNYIIDNIHSAIIGL